MHKKVVTLILAAAVFVTMAGCSNDKENADGYNIAETVNSGDEAVGGAETKEAADNTETECGLKQSYFEEHGIEVEDMPVSCTIDSLLLNLDKPEEYQKIVDSVWKQTDCYTEPAEEGSQLIHLEMTRTVQLYYDVQQNINYITTNWDTVVCDWYTGRL